MGTAPQRDKSSPVLAAFLYFLIVVGGTALVAPRFHATAQFLFQEVNWRFGRLASQPFYRYIYGTLVLLAMVALPWLLKNLRIRSLTDLRLKPDARHFGEAIQGAAWGLISFLLLSALLFASNIRVFDAENSARWVGQLKNFIPVSIGLALLAEILFRGALFTAFRRNHRFWIAAVLSGVFYAFFHFLEKPESPRRIQWTTGFSVLGEMFGPLGDSLGLVPALVNLTLLGILLALALERTGALQFSVGLHASVIFCFKSFGLLTDAASKDASSFWGTDRLFDGWATTIILVLVFLLIERTLPPRKPNDAESKDD
jgi:membrane protease YdiL (CAAX protease family)